MTNDTIEVTSEDEGKAIDPLARIVVWIVCAGVIQGVNLFGIVSNIINIMCFARQGLKEAINVSFMGLAVSDLCCLVTASLLNVWFIFWLSETPVTFDPISVGYVSAGIPHVTFVRVTSWITAIIIIERCVCILVPLKVHILITPRRMSVIIVCVFLANLTSGFPIYLINSLGVRYIPSMNISLLAIVTVPNSESLEAIYYTINNVLLPFLAFIIIGICTGILVYNLNQQTKWRDTSTTAATSNISTRNQKAAMMVVMISVLFISCFIPVSMAMLAIAVIPGFNFGGKYVNVSIIVCNAITLLESVNSSANIFIYFQMSSKYRNTFSELFYKAEDRKKNDCVRVNDPSSHHAIIVS